jgi:hypothetical protein
MFEQFPGLEADSWNLESGLSQELRCWSSTGESFHPCHVVVRWCVENRRWQSVGERSPQNHRTIDNRLLRPSRFFWYAPICRISSTCMLVHVLDTSTFLCKYIVVQESFRVVQENRSIPLPFVAGYSLAIASNHMSRRPRHGPATGPHN